MNYEKVWQKTLNQSEKVEYEFSVAKQYRKFVLINAVIWGILLCFITPYLGILFFLIGVIFYWYLQFTIYALTEKRILVHKGWLSTNSTSISYDKIVEISVSESFIDRILAKSGSLVIKTGGFGHDVLLKNIESPYEVKKKIDQLSHHS